MCITRRDVLSANPERSIPIGERGRGVPDIALVEMSGLPVVIEGRIGDKPGVEQSLDADCPRRIEDGLAAVVVGVVYPKAVRTAPTLLAVEEILSQTELKAKVFSDAGTTEWTSTDLDGLASLLGRTYESLVKDSVVDTLVGRLNDAIEVASHKLARSAGTADRLREVLVVPKSD